VCSSQGCLLNGTFCILYLTEHKTNECLQNMIGVSSTVLIAFISHLDHVPTHTFNSFFRVPPPLLSGDDGPEDLDGHNFLEMILFPRNFISISIVALAI
jgi:hypothetical protein